MIELFRLQVFRWRNRLNDIADLVKGIHDHVSARCLQEARVGETDVYMKDRHTALLRRAHRVLVILGIIERRCGRCLSCRRLRCGWRCFRLWLRLALGNGRELLHEVGNVDEILGIAVADVLDHLLQGVKALEDRLNDVFRHLELVVADEVKDIFHLVRKFGDLVEPHRRRHAFQRMRVTKDLVDDGHLVRVIFEAQQTIVQGLQMFARLVQKHVHVLICFHIQIPLFVFCRLRASCSLQYLRKRHSSLSVCSATFAKSPGTSQAERESRITCIIL